MGTWAELDKSFRRLLAPASSAREAAELTRSAKVLYILFSFVTCLIAAFFFLGVWTIPIVVAVSFVFAFSFSPGPRRYVLTGVLLALPLEAFAWWFLLKVGH